MTEDDEEKIKEAVEEMRSELYELDRILDDDRTPAEEKLADLEDVRDGLGSALETISDIVAPPPRPRQPGELR